MTNAPTSNPDSLEHLPQTTRQKLEAAQRTLETEAGADGTGHATVALGKLKTAIVNNSREQVSLGLKAIRNQRDLAISAGLRTELDALQGEVETGTEKGVRITEETIDTAKAYTYDKLPTVGKAGVLIGGTVVSAALLPKIWKAFTNLPATIGKGASNIGKGFMWVLKKVLGVGAIALGTVGVMKLWNHFQPNQAQAQTPAVPNPNTPTVNP